MSVLSYPRIHFKGKCRVSPATGNNDDVAVNIDAVNVALLPALADLEDQHARAWMMGEFQAIGPDKVTLQTYLRSGWNYFGTLQARFEQARVVSVVGEDGSLTTDDPVVGKTIKILAAQAPGTLERQAAKFQRKLLSGARLPLKGDVAPPASGRPSRGPLPEPVVCDVDSMGGGMTQLFVGGLSLGTSELGFKAWHNTKAFNRWVRFRNASTYHGEQFFVGAGATWQFGIPSDAVKYFRPQGSDALAELQTAANNHRGILVQFGMYLAEPEITDVDLYEQFQNGETPENAVQPLIVGTLGVWEDGELETAPAGRLMRTPPAWPPPPDVIDPAAKFLGPALARVHPKRNVVSLNLITTFPEADYNHPPEKADLGRVRLGYVASTGGPAVPISGPLAYDAETYELTGGILDVRYDHRRVSHSELQRGTLVLLGESKCDGSQIVMLTEEGSTTTVATDDFGLHLDVGDGPTNSANIRILVRERDRPPSKDVTVYLREYQFAGGPAEFQHRASFQLTLVEDGPPLEHRICFEREVVFPAGKKDTMDVPITACRPGGVALAFTLEDRAFQEAWPWDTAFYTAVRVMPDDAYSSICQDVRVSFAFMYATVFRYYYLIFPVMSEIIPFNCEQAMEDEAQGFVSVTDPQLIDTTLYMPISRDLSTGKRNLIVEWAEYVKRKRKGTGG